MYSFCGFAWTFTALAAPPLAAQAITYDLVTDFALLPSTSSVFQYGYRVGETFTADDSHTTTCAGISGLSCNYASAFNNNNLPAVGINTKIGDGERQRSLRIRLDGA